MTPRHKNMLEAFQASTQAPSQPAAPMPGAAASKSGSGASKAGSSARARSERIKSPSLEDLPADLGRKRLEPVLAVTAGALLLVLAFFLGRFSVGDPAHAADGEDVVEHDSANNTAASGFDLGIEHGEDRNVIHDEITPPQDTPLDDAPSDAHAGLETAEDLAFFDPANRYTVRAFRYGVEESDRFNDDYWRLKDAGLPVVQPVQSPDGRWVDLCVGAQASLGDEIDAILARLQSMPAFASAYVDNIDNVIQR